MCIRDRLCPGDSIILFGSGGVNYTWSPDSTLINSLTPNPTAFPFDNEELILLEKLQEICDDMDNMICTTQKPFIRLNLWK